MRRMIPAAMAALLALSASPAFAADDEATAADDEAPATDELAAVEPTWQRVEADEAGLAMAFPDDWRVSQPEGLRESEIHTPEGEPVYVTTAILANGGDGRWCDVDVYIDMIAALEEHAHAYAGYLQRVHGADVPMVLVEAELPAGPAFRIEIFDPERARVRVMYLFDGPLAEDDTFDRYLLTCAAPSDADPFWQPIAESAEVFAATEPEPEA